jgi:uncharacterized protein
MSTVPASRPPGDAQPLGTPPGTPPGTQPDTLPDSRTGRDRDEVGRARNARPRDALGRPLTRDAHGEPLTSDEVLEPALALEAAQQLIDSGRPFHAHEVLEAVWKAAPDAERDLWRGLAQLAVGLTHALRGNPRGAATLLQRGADRLGTYPSKGPHHIDVAGLRATSASLARQIESSGLADLDPTRLRLKLTLSPEDRPAESGRHPDG